jgi:hypothetical protein
MTNQLSRRTILRGLGAAIALPWLEAMGPITSWGAAPVVKGAAPIAPTRMAFLYVPNGVNIENWTPKAEGRDYEMTKCLEPLQAYRNDFNVLTGLTADKARSHGDGGGDHARALGAFLTGAQPRKTDGTDIRTGVSVDQLAASRIGDRTRLPSLEIGVEPGGMAGNCDSGYSCVYSSTMCWRSATTPVPKETNPKLVFDRMFKTDASADQAAARKRRKSVLDAVMEDAKDLEKNLGGHDLRKLDEYLSSVRDVELRIERAAKLPAITAPDYPEMMANSNEREQKIRLMCDLMVLGFQTDVTRICTFVIANEGSGASYKFIDVPEGTTNSRTMATTKRRKKRSARSTASTPRSSPTYSANSRACAKETARSWTTACSPTAAATPTATSTITTTSRSSRQATAAARSKPAATSAMPTKRR